MMSQSHRIKGGTPDEVFQKQCFLFETGASVGVDLLTLKIFYMHKKNVNTKGKEKTKA